MYYFGLSSFAQHVCYDSHYSCVELYLFSFLYEYATEYVAILLIKNICTPYEDHYG